MKKAIIGKKVGMTQIFDETGKVIPVTVIEAGPCLVLQKKTLKSEGYDAIQVGFVDADVKKITKPLAGHFQKEKLTPKKYIRELRLDDSESYEVGQEIKVEAFSEGDFVDVTGISRGKGFAGSIKRHGQSRGPTTHGSHYHRGPGSMGSVDGARVFKGKKLPGRMGGDQVTVQGLQVARVDKERNLILIRGAVPGSRGALVTVKNSVKA